MKENEIDNEQKTERNKEKDKEKIKNGKRQRRGEPSFLVFFEFLLLNFE